MIFLRAIKRCVARFASDPRHRHHSTSERYQSDAGNSSKRYRQVIGKCDAKLYRNDIGNFGKNFLAPPGFEPVYTDSPFQYATTVLLWYLFYLVKIVNTLNTFVNTFQED